MLSIKILYEQEGVGEYLTDGMREKVQSEHVWSMKLLKIYRTLHKLEKRKYSGGHFAPEIRQLIRYFSAKHLLKQNDAEKEDDAASMYSDGEGGDNNRSVMSSVAVSKSPEDVHRK